MYKTFKLVLLILRCSFEYYLKHERKRFIMYKMRGAAERFISDKVRIASVLNSFKKDPFYTHLVFCSRLKAFMCACYLFSSSLGM